MKYNYVANEVGIAYNSGLFRQIKLRETKKYWINEHGRKYNKDTGTIAGGRFEAFKLDISSIKEYK